MKENTKKDCFCSKEAFTLIELLVVVLIIGILAAVAVPQYRVAMAKSRYANIKQLAHALADAQEIYYLDHGNYTTDIRQLDVTFKNSSDIVVSLFSDDLAVWDKKMNIGYYIYYKHSSSYPSQRRCLISTMDPTDYRNKVCKEELGAGAYMRTPEGGYIRWILNP